MKKLLFIAILSICSVATQAQGLTVSTPINTSDGDTKTNTFCWVNFDVEQMLKTGIVSCELMFYNSQAAKTGGKDQVYPLFLDANNIPYKLTSCTITVSTSDVVKASGQSTMADVVTLFYSKVKAVLLSQYGLTSN